MSLTDISKASEAVEQFINDLAAGFRERSWVKILSFLGVVCALFLNPLSVEYGLKIVGVEKPGWYSSRVWLTATGLFFVTAFLVALLTRRRQEKDTATGATSIIKGLLPYANTKEDVEWFARLQRGRILQDCLGFCTGRDSSFAILSGESGTGKTSFLQAGLSPNLERQGQRPIYVKFTDTPALDSIRRSLNQQLEAALPDENHSLLDLIRAAMLDNSRPLVLIFDQFEQFFAHQKSKALRKPFIQQMAEWHKHSETLPVKILISIRGDFANRMNEFQKEMKYALTQHTNFSLEKFEPQEAAHVLNVIAREAKIEFDEAFLKELTKNELADSEGTISPVDIQILSWLIDGQKSSEERAFNRRVFQKLGGVEGLLERVLNRQLKARETEGRRQSAIKVMLALTDQNVLAGALSLKELKEKLRGIVPEQHVEEAVLWLAKSEVRFITPIQEKNITLYELAHERLIPPLRRLVFDEITASEKAQQTLDRRLNEWIGNNRSRKYLLTFNEWRLVRRHRNAIISGSQKEQKEEFVSRSKSRFVLNGLVWSIILLSGIAGYESYVWYERRPETQIHHARKRLGQLVEENKNFDALVSSSLLLPVLESEKDQELESKIWQQLDGLDPVSLSNSLAWIGKTYGKFGKHGNVDAAVRGLERVLQEAQKLHPNYESNVILAVAEAYGDLPTNDATKNGLDKIRILLNESSQITEKLNTDDKVRYLESLAQVYSKLPKTEQTVDSLNRIQRTTSTLEPFLQAPILSQLTNAYRGLPKTSEAVNGLKNVEQAVDRVLQAAPTSGRYQRPTMMSYAATAYGGLEDTEAAVRGLEKVRKASRQLDPYEQAGVLRPMAEAYGNILNAAEAMNGLDRIHDEIDRVWNPREMFVPDQVFALIALVVGYSKLATTQDEVSRAVSHLDRLLKAAEVFNHSYQASMLREVARAYGRLPKTNEALNGLDRLQQTTDEFWKTTVKLERSDQADVLTNLAETYVTLPNVDDALKGLDKVRQAADKLVPAYRARVLLSLAEGNHKLGRAADALKYLTEVQQAANDAVAGYKTFALGNSALLYAKLHKWRDALELAQAVTDPVHQIRTYALILIIWVDAKNGTKNMEALEEMFPVSPYSYTG
jgi:lipopolysaccharide biosynthesis regulator YciM